MGRPLQDRYTQPYSRTQTTPENLTKAQNAQREQQRIRSTLSRGDLHTYDGFDQTRVVQVIATIQHCRSLEDPMSDWDIYLRYQRQIAQGDASEEFIEKAQIANFLKVGSKQEARFMVL